MSVYTIKPFLTFTFILSSALLHPLFATVAEAKNGVVIELAAGTFKRYKGLQAR